MVVSMPADFLANLPKRRAEGARAGIVSVCSAHPVVIHAALRHGLTHDDPVLIEATCNQVNQDGGYTGMTPADFRTFVETIADAVGFAKQRLLFGGDHLGPNPWKGLPAEQALAKSEVMIAAFVRAGFSKIHIDTSMGCLDEPVALNDHETAKRAVRLARAAEAARLPETPAPVYIIGTEVPIPGGATEALDHIEVTDAAAAKQTVAIHRAAFEAAGLDDAFSRVIGLVVQPGVEFGHDSVMIYAPDAARTLSQSLADLPGLVFEAHSTDYQPVTALSALVRDGFAILKVGPELTFALRQALYGLDHIARDLGLSMGSLKDTVEKIMLDEPQHWKAYYSGDDKALHVQRHYSLSDRIRYYWPNPDIHAAVQRLLAALGDTTIPAPLIHQYLPFACNADAGLPVTASARDLLEQAVTCVLERYRRAIVGG